MGRFRGSAPMLFLALLTASPWLAASPGAACAASPASHMVLEQSATVTSVRYDFAPPLSLQAGTVPEFQAALTANASMPDHTVQQMMDVLLGMATVPSGTYAPHLKIWSHAGTTDKEGPVEAQFVLSYHYGNTEVYNTPPSPEVELATPGATTVNWNPYPDVEVVAQAVPNNGYIQLTVQLEPIPSAFLPRCGETRASTGQGTIVTSVTESREHETFPPPVTVTIDNLGNNGGFRVHCEQQVITRLDYEFTELASETSHAGTLNVLCQ